jgi:hypothetical protein
MTSCWLNVDYEYSEDGLTLTIHNFWNSEEDYLKFKSDPLGFEKFNSLMNAYCLKNNLMTEVLAPA